MVNKRLRSPDGKEWPAMILILTLELSGMDIDIIDEAGPNPQKATLFS